MDSVFKTGKNYYPQVFLEECKYAGKEKKRCYSILPIREEKILRREEKILMKKFPVKKNLMKKIQMKRIKYRMRLFLHLKHFK